MKAPSDELRRLLQDLAIASEEEADALHAQGDVAGVDLALLRRRSRKAGSCHDRTPERHMTYSGINYQVVDTNCVDSTGTRRRC